MLSIVVAPNTVLSEKALLVEKIDNSIKKLISEMKETLSHTKDPEGVGLAAPQVGRSLRIFIIKPDKNAGVEVFINPEITEIKKQIIINEKDKIKKKRLSKLEGCLSLPTIWGPVNRENKLSTTYMDEGGKQKTKIFSGFSAIIIQHEMDHLDGILFPKRVLEQKGILYKSHKNEKNEDIFEELEI